MPCMKIAYIRYDGKHKSRQKEDHKTIIRQGQTRQGKGKKRQGKTGKGNGKAKQGKGKGKTTQGKARLGMGWGLGV